MNETRLAVNKTELARMLCVSRPIVYQIIKREDFPRPFRINSKELYSVDDVRDWIRGQTQKVE